MLHLKLNFDLKRLLPPRVQRRIGFGLRIAIFTVAMATLGALIFDYGFTIGDAERHVLTKVYNIAWWIFLIAFCFRLVFSRKSIRGRNVALTVIGGVALLLAELPAMWPALRSTFLADPLFLKSVLGIYSVIEASSGIVGFINRKTNPALLMAACFTVIVLLGTLLLMLPRSLAPGVSLSIFDGLFVATSAVCITGLTPVDIASTFSLEGQIVILLLIQTGGLGVMTITSFFAMFFMGGAGLQGQFALRDMVGSDTFSSLISTLLYILGFTFIIELCGAAVIWLNIHGSLPLSLHQEIFFAIFHSVSAFCNAGFATCSLEQFVVEGNHNGLFLTLTALVVLGGLGFPIVMNLRRVAGYWLRKFFGLFIRSLRRRDRIVHLANINTKIVLAGTVILLLAGSGLLAMLEWNNALASLPVGDRVVQSLFNSACARTAGFSSIPMANFSLLSLVVIAVLMWIGGGSQSTAGGVKINTVAVMFANIRAVSRGRSTTTLLGREIPADSVRRASAVVMASICTIIAGFIAIVALEPQLSARAILFEVISATSTVGSSMGITAMLGPVSKVVIVLLMFAGRVGLITVLMSVTPQTGDTRYRYPQDNIIIN